jgi:hypothetical protein
VSLTVSGGLQASVLPLQAVSVITIPEPNAT